MARQSHHERVATAEELAAALVHIWIHVGDDPMQKRRVSVIADDIVYADLQAAAYRQSRVALSPVANEAPNHEDGSTDQHWVRTEAATHVAAAVKMAEGDVDQLAHWATVCRSLDVLWPESSSQARAILAGLLPKREDTGAD